MASIGVIDITAADERRIRKQLLAVPVDRHDSTALQLLVAVPLIIVAQLPNWMGGATNYPAPRCSRVMIYLAGWVAHG
jgi:hypothetical protein